MKTRHFSANFLHINTIFTFETTNLTILWSCVGNINQNFSKSAVLVQELFCIATNGVRAIN